MLGLLALRHDFRVARLDRDVQAHRGASPLELALVFERLRALGYGRLALATRHLMVRTVSRNAGTSSTGGLMRAALFFCYLGLLVGASVAGFRALRPVGPSHTSSSVSSVPCSDRRTEARARVTETPHSSWLLWCEGKKGDVREVVGESVGEAIDQLCATGCERVIALSRKDPMP
jgi:hypothetical protein